MKLKSGLCKLAVAIIYPFIVLGFFFKNFFCARQTVLLPKPLRPLPPSIHSQVAADDSIYINSNCQQKKSISAVGTPPRSEVSKYQDGFTTPPRKKVYTYRESDSCSSPRGAIGGHSVFHANNERPPFLSPVNLPLYTLHEDEEVLSECFEPNKRHKISHVESKIAAFDFFSAQNTDQKSDRFLKRSVSASPTTVVAVTSCLKGINFYHEGSASIMEEMVERPNSIVTRLYDDVRKRQRKRSFNGNELQNLFSMGRVPARMSGNGSSSVRKGRRNNGLSS